MTQAQLNALLLSLGLAVCPAQQWCLNQARAWCIEQRMEPTCAFGEPEQNTPCGSMQFLLASDGGFL